MVTPEVIEAVVKGTAEAFKRKLVCEAERNEIFNHEPRVSFGLYAYLVMERQSLREVGADHLEQQTRVPM